METRTDGSLGLAAALREREQQIERLEREADALRSELAVRDGYLADLRARLAESSEREDRALRTGQVARERLARIAADTYVRAVLDEDAIRARIADAIRRVSELKDRERAQALRTLRELRRS